MCHRMHVTWLYLHLQWCFYLLFQNEWRGMQVSLDFGASFVEVQLPTVDSSQVRWFMPPTFTYYGIRNTYSGLKSVLLCALYCLIKKNV